MEKKTTQKKTAPKKPASKTMVKKVPAKKTPLEARSQNLPRQWRGPEASVYSIAGKEVGTISLPEELFDVAWNNDLIHQVARSMMSNARAGRGQAHTKDRSEVRGGGKKPWRQKGTGRARHGSIRSPIWVGGGVTHGPRKEKDYSKRIPRRMRAKALAVALSKKLRDGEIIFVDSLSFSAPKASDAKNMLNALTAIDGFDKLSTKKNNALFVALADNNENAKLSFSNFGNVEIDELRNLNVVDILSSTYLLIENPKDSLAQLANKTKAR